MQSTAGQRRRADYPLAAVAIRIRSSTYNDFILEFFLPRDCKNDEEKLQIQSSIVSMIQRFSWSFRVLNDEEESEEVYKETNTQRRDESWISHMLEAQQRGENVIVSMGCHKQEPAEEFQLINELYNNGFNFSDPEKQMYLEWGSKSRSQSQPASKKSTRVKTERNISLQVLQQYFPGSLKDAAKSIGVCPTTLKRICRQHGIMRWPSRKIKKVSHSLKKLQLVIDSVQGAEGMIKLGSFYSNFPELSNAQNTLLPESKVNLKSSSSGSHGSSSSLCGSTEKGQEKLVVTTPENDKFFEVHNHSPPPKMNSPISSDECVFRVKATFGEEKIRFRMSKNWSFGDLKSEMKKRFNVHDMGNMTLEYVDDESEWVLLACDADLEECMDLHLSNKNQTIKLFLYQSTHPSFMPMVDVNDDMNVW